MRLILLILFIAMPLMEIAVLIQLGQAIGFWTTILLVIATAVIGTTVLHAQGFSVLQRAGETLRRGGAPIEPVAEGVLLVVAGAFLLTPGLITDSIGAVLLVPPLRQWIARWGLKRVFAVGQVDISGFDHPGDSDPRSHPSRDGGSEESVIEGEFTRVDERTVNPGRSKNR